MDIKIKTRKGWKRKSPLLAYLKQTNQSVLDFHRRSGINRATIYNILRGTKPHPATLRRLCTKSDGVLKREDFWNVK